MTIWTLTASIASIMSLIFHLSGKGSTLRQFTLPTTTALVGYAIGTHTSAIEQSSSSLLQDPHLVFMIIVMVLVFALTMYLVESLKPDAKVSFIFLVFLSTIAIPQSIKSYNDIAPMVSTEDYLALARVKETDGNIEDAIKYLKIYSKRVDRSGLKKQVNDRIENLRQQQFKRESTKGLTNK